MTRPDAHESEATEVEQQLETIHRSLLGQAADRARRAERRADRLHGALETLVAAVEARTGGSGRGDKVSLHFTGASFDALLDAVDAARHATEGSGDAPR